MINGRLVKRNKNHKNSFNFNFNFSLMIIGLFAAGAACFLIGQVHQTTFYETLMMANLSGPSAAQINVKNLPAAPILKHFASETDFKQYLLDSNSMESPIGKNNSNSLNFFAALKMLSETKISDNQPTADINDLSQKINTDFLDIAEDSDQSITNNNQFFDLTKTGIELFDSAQQNNKAIFFSAAGQYQSNSGLKNKTQISLNNNGKTYVITKDADGGIKQVDSLEGRGNILLWQDVLMIFNANQILGYDISDPERAILKWKIRIDDASQVVNAGNYSGQPYFILRSAINFNKPCPVRPLINTTNSFIVQCEDIHYSDNKLPADSIFTIIAFDPYKGEPDRAFSFAADDNSLIYASENNLFIGLSYWMDPAQFFTGFLSNSGTEIVPEVIKKKISQLASYDLSVSAKISQLNYLLQGYVQNLSNDQRVSFENKLAAQLSSYTAAHSYDLERTKLIKIRLADFLPSAAGETAGHPIDKYSAAEDDDYFYIATMSGDLGDFSRQIGSVNFDVTVFDSNLAPIGFAYDIGLGKTISWARFGSSIGYYSAGRAVDPILTIDFSNRKNPKINGKIDLPADSTYIFSYTPNKILTVSKDGWKTKLSLFDVSLAAAPKLLDEYLLNDYWADISDKYKSFAFDSWNNLIFAPSAKGGYIFDMTNDKFALKKTISGISPMRVLHSNDYLYLISNQQIVVVDETSLAKVSIINVK